MRRRVEKPALLRTVRGIFSEGLEEHSGRDYAVGAWLAIYSEGIHSRGERV
jgi:hypothetical protein